MADQYPDEGLDVILGVIPKGGATLPTLWMGLFTSSNTGSVVPASGATIAAMGTGFAEVTTGASPTGWTTYTRMSITGTSGWGAQGVQTLWGNPAGRGVVGNAQSTFPTPVAVYTPTNPICGFFLADAVTAGHAIWYSNFTDTTPITTLAIGDIVKVTPTFGFTG